jgi:hypothetical protein
MGLTKKAKTLAFLPLCPALYMLYLGFSTMRGFHPSDPARYMFGLPPLVIAVCIVAILVKIPRRFAKGRITLRDTGIEYDPGSHDLNLHFPWGDLLFSAPRSPQQMVRSLLLVHRDKKVLIYDLFMPNFEVLMTEVTRRKGRHSSAQAAGGGLKIDSGKVGNIDPRMTGR